ncbi:MAG: response regulator transcription factor [Spirochaetaceae bacterium]|nr:response regulator transcription factor [Spirochaetaceae bacterium]
MEKILLVEDEPGIASFVRLELLHEGYQVQVAEDGRQGLELFQEGQWDLILLDIMLPGINGLEVLRRIRKLSSVPVILLTARGDTLDKVSGLDAGADDYLPKPFAIEELLARIRSLLRRKNAWGSETVSAQATSTQDEGLLFFRNITLNPKSREVSLDGQLLALTKTEYQLLFCLMSHKNEALSREQIMNMVWGQEHYIDPNSVDVYVRYLRNKLDVAGKESCITTLRGIGYIMKEPS